MTVINPSIKYPTSLKNPTCVYCGYKFTSRRERTKEHVIAQKFVPHGALVDQWNLIVKSCITCNNEKSKLEDDISTITMLPDATGRYPADDHRVSDTLARKLKNCRSRATSKLVSDSDTSFNVQCNGEGLSVKFGFIGPPQISLDRIFSLASYHFSAFFYLLTYQEKENIGYFNPGEFVPLFSARQGDWGNPKLLWFQELIRDWRFRAHFIAADTFFKCIIRKHPNVEDVWAWAFEWNRSQRVVGLAGNEQIIKTIIANMPEQKYKYINLADKTYTRYFLETTIQEIDDYLFDSDLDNY